MEEEKQYSKELYKYWYSYKGNGGFMSVSTWLEANKISIDIGSLSDSGGKTNLNGHTMVWANALDVHAYLGAIVFGTASELYPANERAGLAYDESYSYFGGGIMDSKTVSRILKIHHWEGKSGEEIPNAFAWKTGHFEGTASATGAIMPNMSKSLSTNLIKIPKLEMVKLYHRLNFTLNAYATSKMCKGEDWWDFGGKKND